MRRLTEIGEGSGDIQMIQLEDSGYIYSMMKKEHRMDVVRRYSELICPNCMAELVPADFFSFSNLKALLLDVKAKVAATRASSLKYTKIFKTFQPHPKIKTSKF
jgi:hypothetical protein